MAITLVLGGARSGKTRYALKAAEAQPGALVMIATAEALDDEMAERIARHRAERGPRWRTVEAPLALADAIGALSPDEICVVDCLTLWLSNVMLADRAVGAEADRLLGVFEDRNLILVSNEVGGGVVPDNALARRFRDEAGRLNQRLASRADKVVLVTAGLPLTLKP
jgi:adenosylcobinamide kinase/adenosylcobinamide-phosphate guanylyltransferase